MWKKQDSVSNNKSDGDARLRSTSTSSVSSSDSMPSFFRSGSFHVASTARRGGRSSHSIEVDSSFHSLNSSAHDLSSSRQDPASLLEDPRRMANRQHRLRLQIEFLRVFCDHIRFVEISQQHLMSPSPHSNAMLNSPVEWVIHAVTQALKQPSASIKGEVIENVLMFSVSCTCLTSLVVVGNCSLASLAEKT